MTAENDKIKAAPKDDEESVTLKPGQYRSMILAKLRSDIAAKQALLAASSVADIEDLSPMSYYKISYYKISYYKLFSK
ncbi:hypothetical protein QGN32_08360 [Mycolicibacterium sp. ND9-15]|uniref:hypothetical protein n=1 Tax=Mycolicibacterium sp. ND9-15 TaxID=3042320 RepID=UPI002DD914E1|nr:hypothetical protein [Mycolicibacterium sp. ND9-15]WSE57849.1 hypothetical protein QGN32_08360 [Mycolicibacterium sp. ND9-15]